MSNRLAAVAWENKVQPDRPAVQPLRILHVLDHSLPLHSGYTFRTLSILAHQRRLGWKTFQLTSPKQGSGSEREQQIG
jgi:hypothetical protein